jgi:hypothetical protein
MEYRFPTLPEIFLLAVTTRLALKHIQPPAPLPLWEKGRSLKLTIQLLLVMVKNM